MEHCTHARTHAHTHAHSVNHWLKAGITLADTVIILRDPVTPEKLENEQQEHFADSAHIMAVQKLTQLFPHVSIVTELHYRYNIRFMRFTDCDYHFMGNLNTLVSACLYGYCLYGDQACSLRYYRSGRGIT